MSIFNNILSKAGLVTVRDKNRAVKRAEARGWKAATVTRLTSDFLGTSNSINQDLKTDKAKVRARTRQIWNDDDYTQAFKHTLKANVIGPKGFVLQSKIKNADGTEDNYANNAIEKAWKKWCRKEYCTMSGTFNFITVQLIAAQQLERDGEFICRIVKDIDERKNPFGVSLELIEPDYLDETYNDELSNGNVVVMGVEINEWKRPVAFYFKKRLAKYELYGSYYGASRYELERVPAEDIIFVYDPEYSNQLRGISSLASALITHHHLNGYIEGHVVAARVGADKMVMIESEGANEDDDYEGDEVDEEGRKLEHMSPGMTHYLRPGEKATMMDPTYPQGEFWSFVKAMLKKFFAGRGVDYSSATGDLDGVSYSAMRQGKENERNSFMMKQQLLEDYFVNPIYEVVLRYMLLYGVVNLPYSKFEKFNEKVWIPKRWPYFDPLKDVQASVLAINNGLTTRGRELSKQGEDYSETINDLASEMNEADKLNINFGAPKDGLELIKAAAEDQPDEENNDENTGSGSGNSKRTGTDGRILRIK